MRNILLLQLLIMVLFTSCLKEGSNYIRYTGYIEIDSIGIPDTATVGQAFNVHVKGGAPNGCWHNLELTLSKEGDSTVYLIGTGTFESTDGLCTDVYQIIDSVFTYKPTKIGKILFLGVSADTVLRDSVFVH